MPEPPAEAGVGRVLQTRAYFSEASGDVLAVYSIVAGGELILDEGGIQDEAAAFEEMLRRRQEGPFDFLIVDEHEVMRAGPLRVDLERRQLHAATPNSE
jgi:hypothetical protein